MRTCILKTLASLSVFSALAMPFGAAAQAVDLPEIPQCTQLTPGALAVTATPVTLSVRVLMDGVTQAQAQAVVNKAQQAYTSQQMTISPSYQAVSFSGTDALNLITQARNFYGGARPSGIDLVYVLTIKDIASGVAGSAVAGMADCIGGVAFGDRAFAVGERIADFPSNLLVYTLGVDLAGKTMAHELGHLLGAHHHYANCVESLVATGDSICTLMFNDLGFQRLQFSTLNSLVVRGHAQLFAAP